MFRDGARHTFLRIEHFIFFIMAVPISLTSFSGEIFLPDISPLINKLYKNFFDSEKILQFYALAMPTLVQKI